MEVINMKCSWHGHSVIQLELDSYKLIIDPFIEGNSLCDLDVDNLKVDYILLTHAHNDHVGDTIQLAKNNNATVIAMVELADYLSQFGIQTHGMNIGGAFDFPFGRVKFTQAFHSSTYNDGEKDIAMGLAGGIMIDNGKHKLYHAGDTALFGDMKHIGPVDIAFLPIGDNFTMGIDDAVKAAKLIQCKTVVPIHYNTFPIIEQNPQDFIRKLEVGMGKVFEIGVKFEVS